MSRPQRIGFTGLGMMGAPMAEGLSEAGFELSLADADMERPRKITNELRAKRLDRENASTLDVLITMLPNSNIVEAVRLGSDRDGQTNGWVAAPEKCATQPPERRGPNSRTRGIDFHCRNYGR